MIRWLVAICVALAGTAQAELLLTQTEIDKTLSFGPWPPAFKADPSNRVSGNPRAVKLGRALFNDPVLSVDGAFSCASCHDPGQAFTTPLARAMGRTLLARNSPSVQNLTGCLLYTSPSPRDS